MSFLWFPHRLLLLFFSSLVVDFHHLMHLFTQNRVGTFHVDVATILHLTSAEKLMKMSLWIASIAYSARISNVKREKKTRLMSLWVRIWIEYALWIVVNANDDEEMKKTWEMMYEQDVLHHLSGLTFQLHYVVTFVIIDSRKTPTKIAWNAKGSNGWNNP